MAVLGGSILASATGVMLASLLARQAPWLVAVIAGGSFGLVYVVCTALLGHADAKALVRRFAPRD
jgi:hypothetical protein